MRVFVSFEESVHCLDVDVKETVRDIKITLGERFGLNLRNFRNETDSFVALVYQGASLQDSWIYSDLGIPPGSTLSCRVEKQMETSLNVFCTSYDETVVYKQGLDVWNTTVGTLRGIIQDSTGIHVSAFRLYTASGLELFDCHPLNVYKVDAGDMVTMEIWRDVADVVQAARENDITASIGSLASPQDSPHLVRYQLQLGLFTAAHYGYHQLATQLMKCGARPDEPVGQHPSRDWCRSSAHVDHMKTPAHEAAQHGRLKCLQHFLMFNYAVLICKDAHGLTPCNIARRHRQTECFKLLVAEQFRTPRVHPELSVHVYARVRKWCDRARQRARFHKDKTAMLLLTNAAESQKRAVVGQEVEIDGFSGSESDQRMVKTAPSSLTTCYEKIPTSRKSHSSANGISRRKEESVPSFKSTEDPFPLVRENSGITRYKEENDIPSSNLRDSSSKNKNSRHKNYERQSYSELHRRTKDLSASAAYSVTGLKNTVRPMYTFSNYRLGYNTPLKSAATPHMPRAGNMRGRHDTALADKRLREQTSLSRTEEGRSGKEERCRYIWKTLDDRFRENEDDDGDVHRISEDKTGLAGISNDTPNYTMSGEISEKWRPGGESRWKINATDRSTKGERSKAEQLVKRSFLAYSSNNSVKTTSKVDRPVLNRSKIEIGHRVATSSMNKQLDHRPATQARTVVEELHQRNSPLKRRSAQSKNTVFQSSVDSTADKCLRVACETFRKKSWLGQLQMALVVNTNMCKRRQDASLRHSGDL